MTVDATKLESYTDKSVVLQRIQEDGELIELEGKVEAASEQGMAFKEKGKRDVILILPAEIEEIEEAPETPKRIAQKTLKLVKVTNVRQHLVDRHGMLRSDANSMTDEAAMEYHDEIDHSDLGHKHESEEEEADTEAELEEEVA